MFENALLQFNLFTFTFIYNPFPLIFSKAICSYTRFVHTPLPCLSHGYNPEIDKKQTEQ